MPENKKKPNRTEEGKTKILIVDDHPVLRRGLIQVINEEPDFEVCAEAENAAQALEAIEKQPVDLAIVDISLEGTDGIELTARIRSERPHIPVLVLTMHEEREYAKRALGAGAKGYVTKHEDAETIITAIRLLLVGKNYVSERITQKLFEDTLDEN
jgi:DNA-binding NarL/FixJ family response regulator